MRRHYPSATIPLAALGLVLATSAAAQEPPRAASETPSGEALRVFLDCARVSCDYDFLRTEIDFVSHVDERHAAQVLVLITMQPTAAGGTEYTASFVGRGEFLGSDDSLRYVAPPAESQDLVRRALADLLKRGLVRYVNHTALAEGLRVSYAPLAPRPSATVRDRWNRWVFGTSLQGSASGERSFRLLRVNGAVSANRTTAAGKVGASLQVG